MRNKWDILGSIDSDIKKRDHSWNIRIIGINELVEVLIDIRDLLKER